MCAAHDSCAAHSSEQPANWHPACATARGISPTGRRPGGKQNINQHAIHSNSIPLRNTNIGNDIKPYSRKTLNSSIKSHNAFTPLCLMRDNAQSRVGGGVCGDHERERRSANQEFPRGSWVESARVSPERSARAARPGQVYTTLHNGQQAPQIVKTLRKGGYYVSEHARAQVLLNRVNVGSHTCTTGIGTSSDDSSLSPMSLPHCGLT